MRLHNRQVKASFWEDSKLLRLHRDARTLFHGLFHLADDSGCLERDTFAFKTFLFRSPLDTDVTIERLDELTEQLISAGRLVPYEAKGRQCLFIRNFHKHQILANPGPPDAPLPPWLEYRTYQGKNPSRYLAKDDEPDVSEGDLEDWLCDMLETGQLLVDGQKAISVDRQVRFGNSYLDIVVSTGDNPYVFELKKGRLSKASLKQIMGYIEAHKVAGKPIIPLLVGVGLATSFDMDTANSNGISVFVIENSRVSRVIGRTDLREAPRNNTATSGTYREEEEPEPEPEPLIPPTPPTGGNGNKTPSPEEGEPPVNAAMAALLARHCTAFQLGKRDWDLIDSLVAEGFTDLVLIQQAVDAALKVKRGEIALSTWLPDSIRYYAGWIRKAKRQRDSPAFEPLDLSDLEPQGVSDDGVRRT